MNRQKPVPDYLKGKKRCTAIWLDGYDEGREEGYQNGYEEGYEEGGENTYLDIPDKEQILQEGYDQCYDEHFGGEHESVSIIFEKHLDHVYGVIQNSPYLKELFLGMVKERFGK